MEGKNNSYHQNNGGHKKSQNNNPKHPQQNNGNANNQNNDGARSTFNSLGFKETWITDGADPALVIFAEEAGKYMANNNLKSSKFRSIYGEIKRIQVGGFDKMKTSFLLLKPKVAYAYGRDKKNKGLELFKLIFDNSFSKVTNEQTYENFCNLMEAIIAYHKAYVKKDY